jgi:hypothetical protein
MYRPPGNLYHGIRCIVGIIILLYGGIKLANIQFNPKYQPYLMEAGRPADDLSGIELAWRFFGHSRVYHCLIGLTEVAAGSLLLLFRTAPLGAALLLPVMVNVATVDLLYGIAIAPTILALNLLAGDLCLLYMDRVRVRRAVDSLLRPSDETATWRSVLIGSGLAIVLLVVMQVCMTVLTNLIRILLLAAF